MMEPMTCEVPTYIVQYIGSALKNRESDRGEIFIGKTIFEYVREHAL